MTVFMAGEGAGSCRCPSQCPAVGPTATLAVVRRVTTRNTVSQSDGRLVGPGACIFFKTSKAEYVTLLQIVWSKVLYFDTAKIQKI